MIYKTEEGRREVLRRYEEILDGWPVPAERKRVPTGEGETFVLVSGPEHAPPLVLLHGSGSNAAMWQADVRAWSEDFRVHAVDLIGEPGLSAPTRLPLGSDGIARWLDEVLDGLGLGKAALVGASLGGWHALDYAIRRPDRVTRLALLCPGGLGKQTYGWVLPSLLLKPFGRWGTLRTLKLVAGVDPREAPESAEYVALIFTHFLPRREKLPVFSDAELAKLTMPVRVIVGGRDAMFDSKDTETRARQAIPGVAVTVLPEVAHWIPGQTETLRDFLRG
ncbi:alpha/beta fold hydrolase [Amycolatopsis acidicola]|uniref:Alpha/beta fold hydrolase n=1 Tax=Amycolatopsis acidicola TaxID=2596893 RepID=A0A5N0V104_9PSEU|nr:alpha/beta fold hydrolase [Amycolatopsis acidicola]KAA9157592.1 alpha/beta fold hydrolase [Amycolatopsis acidicola]